MNSLCFVKVLYQLYRSTRFSLRFLQNIYIKLWPENAETPDLKKKKKNLGSQYWTVHLGSSYSPVTSGWSTSFREWRTSGTILWLQLTKSGLSFGTTSTPKCRGLGGSPTVDCVAGCWGGSGRGSCGFGSWGACGCWSWSIGWASATSTVSVFLLSCFPADRNCTLWIFALLQTYFFFIVVYQKAKNLSFCLNRL